MADFGKIQLPSLEGDYDVLDVRKQLGNALYYRSQDLAGSELGKTIYHSDGDIELNDNEVRLVKDMVKEIFSGYVVQKAVLDSLEK